LTALLLLLMASCGGKRAPTASWDATSVAQAAWEREVPFALKAGYTISVDAPTLGVSGSTRGALLVHRPGRFRLEIFSPLGSPLVYIASDGKAASLYLFSQNTWMGTKKAEETLRELTGGAAGLEDLISVMVGQLPFADADILGAERTESGDLQYVFGTPQGGRAEVSLREKDLTTQSLNAYDEAGKQVLTADYNDYMRVGKNRLPEEVVMTIPGINLSLEMSFDTWDELGIIPDSFDVPAPPRSKQIDLLILLQKAREAREAGIQPASLDELMGDDIKE
jgi:outer membrane biogenesis lipoprotein LolB